MTAHVQDQSASGTGSASQQVAISSAAGNALVLCVYADNVASTPISINSVADSAGNTWNYSTLANEGAPPAGGAYNSSSGHYEFCAIAWCVNAAAVSHVTCTLNLAPGTFMLTTVSEFSGVPGGTTLGPSASSAGYSAGSSQTTPTITPSGTGELVIAAASSGNGYTGVSSGFTPVASSFDLFAWEVTSGPGAVSCTFTYSTGQPNFSTCILALGTPVEPVGNPSGPWAEVFNDDFTGTAYNQDVWAPHLVYGDYWRTSDDASNISWCPHNGRGISVANSNLTLTAREESPYSASSPGYDPDCPNPLPGGQPASYTMGLLSSHPGFRITQGYVEARIQVPLGVAGSWPAFWCDPSWATYPPENDIMEYDATDGVLAMRLGYQSSTGVWQNDQYTPADGNYHVYGCAFSPTQITYFLDGVEFYSISADGTAVPWMMIFDNFVQTNATGAGFPYSINVDYVRGWQVQGTPVQPVISTIAPPLRRPHRGQLAGGVRRSIWRH